jgi:hypothetical protein
MKTILVILWLYWFGMGYIGSLFMFTVYRTAGSRLAKKRPVFHLAALMGSLFGLVSWLPAYCYITDPQGTLYYIRHFVIPPNDRD